MTRPRHHVVAVDRHVGDAVPAARVRGWRMLVSAGETRRTRCSRRRRSPVAPTRARFMARERPLAEARRRRRHRHSVVARSWAAAPPHGDREARRHDPVGPEDAERGIAMCIEPPRPRLVPWSCPSARRTCGRVQALGQAVAVTTVGGGDGVSRVQGQQAPTAVASWPIERCTNPGTSRRDTVDPLSKPGLPACRCIPRGRPCEHGRRAGR